ncbi:MAG: RpiB/LacA/LacB family sugar-phosphate isomerase [Phaeodactylibacter sp.]|nr:RpiB/LacA/LacB family sugar-phosphate isomerase [Phaeodactylibacter sp.]MCB9266467.1 RpiB/LacA/LacB family sugar-phosphate isomerase [Lewinellaceae bacterium]MCB9289069.1 RpiB/LacA/LacB family sugar-phosphate isomerase [Lewinellaceae bacterium]
MKIGIAADHGGFSLKQKMIHLLEEGGYHLTDFGAGALDRQDDYPDFVAPLARALAAGLIDRGIAICGSGVGAAIVANKFKGVRAALITETYSARQGVEHDDMNLICLGGRVIGPELAKELVFAFLHAHYSGEDRHQRRLDKLARIEKNSFK